MIYKELVNSIIMDVCDLNQNDDIEFDIIMQNMEQSTLESIHGVLLDNKNSGMSLIEAAIKTRDQVRDRIKNTVIDTTTDVVD